MSRLDLVVGPNGAGKSTFVELVLSGLRPGTVSVNANVIACERWPGDELAHGHDAALAAEEFRSALIANGEPFIAELLPHIRRRSIWTGTPWLRVTTYT